MDIRLLQSVVGRRDHFARSALAYHSPIALAVASSLLAAVPSARAADLPTGGQVVVGRGNISSSNTSTVVDQSSGKLAINWQSFSIGAGHDVTFNQPGRSAVALNRVVGNETSVINGALKANGQVFLVNSNGVLFSAGSQVNTAGLVASTLNISDEDFAAGNYAFQGSSGSSVINQGAITSADGGYVALLGKQVVNAGVIVANRGTVALAGGEKVRLGFGEDGLLNIAIEQGALDALVENAQAIYADGGKVVLRAKAADDLLSAQVNNNGLVQAHTIGDLTGRIEVVAEGGTAHVGGVLDASAPSAGAGGFIETSGGKVKVADSATITTAAASGATGTWLVDPDGFTIAASGGDITGTALSAQLNSNNVSLVSTSGSGSSGNVDVNDAVSWSANNNLTLTATNSINVNKSVSASGASAGLALNYGGNYTIGSGAAVTLSGASASLTINSTPYTLVHSMAQLDALDVGTTPADTATGNFAIAQNLDATGTTYTATGGTYFGVVDKLSGTLAGLGHTISNLTVSAPTTPNVGLIGQTLAGSTVRDIGLVNASVTGTGSIGTLVGWAVNTDVRNSSASGSVTSAATVAGLGSNVGGLVGYLQGGSIRNSSTNVAVDGWVSVGGLVGVIESNGVVTASISGSRALGNVTGKSDNVGGLVGSLTGSVSGSYATGPVSDATLDGNFYGGLVGLMQNYSSVSGSFSTGNVTVGGSGSFIGGLVGQNNGDISGSFSTGNVSGFTNVGGLVGGNSVNSADNTLGGHITGSFSTGAVSGNEVVGGFVGVNGQDTTISGSFSTGSVTAGTGGIAGGFVGANYGAITGSFETGEVTSTGPVAGGFGGINGDTGTIDTVLAFGDVTGTTQVDGLVGLNSGTVENSYSYGAVTSDE